MLILGKGRKALPVGTIREYGGKKFKRMATGWQYVGRSGKTIREKKETVGKKKLVKPVAPKDDWAASGAVLNYLSQRHTGLLRGAKESLKVAVRATGFKTDAEFGAFMMQYGDPDKPGQYGSVRQKWVERVERLRLKKQGKKVPEAKKKAPEKKKAPIKPVVSKGTYYFKDSNSAKQWAKENKWPTDRIIQYDKGWAVQSGKSGNYAGSGEKPKEWEGTEKQKALKEPGVKLYKMKVVNPSQFLEKSLPEKRQLVFRKGCGTKTAGAKAPAKEGAGKDEAAWDRAKAEAKKGYPEMSEDDDRFWKIVQKIYKQMK